MTGQSCNKSLDSGYTLIEVLIAIAIFSIGLMAMGALQNRSLMQTGEVGRKTEAWSLLEDQAERLKSLPFYANDNGIDDDGDGTVDEVDELFADENGLFPLATGNHSVDRLDGRYTVHWEVVDDQPIAQQDETVLPGVPVGDYTVSKTIAITVTLAGGNPQTDALAMAQFVKVWASDPGGIP